MSPTIRINELELDEANVEKLADHGIEAWEAAELIWNCHVTRPNPRSVGRVSLIGVTNGGRHLMLALDPTDDPGTWYVVTGLPADAPDVAVWRTHCG